MIAERTKLCVADVERLLMKSLSVSLLDSFVSLLVVVSFGNILFGGLFYKIGSSYLHSGCV